MACQPNRIDDIDKYLNGQLVGDALLEFEEHLFNCTICFQELTVTDKMAQLIKTEGNVLFAKELHELDPGRATLYKPKPRSPWAKIQTGIRQAVSGAFSRPKRAFGWAGVAVVLAVTVLFLMQPERSDKLRLITREPSIDQQSPEIEPFFPPNRALVEIQRPEFRWSTRSDIAVYHFVLFDDDGDIVWKRETAQSQLTLPDSISLQDNMTYFWQIEGKLQSGVLLPSKMARFTYREK